MYLRNCPAFGRSEPPGGVSCGIIAEKSLTPPFLLPANPLPCFPPGLPEFCLLSGTATCKQKTCEVADNFPPPPLRSLCPQFLHFLGWERATF